MSIFIQYVQMRTSESMNAIVHRKMNHLKKKFNWIMRSDVFFKQENDATGANKICEIKLSVPGSGLFAKAKTDDFEKSLAQTVDDLERQLRKRKTILERH